MCAQLKLQELPNRTPQSDRDIQLEEYERDVQLLEKLERLQLAFRRQSSRIFRWWLHILLLFFTLEFVHEFYHQCTLLLASQSATNGYAMPNLSIVLESVLRRNIFVFSWVGFTLLCLFRRMT